MKFTILQICNELICLTPAETIKVKLQTEVNNKNRSLFSNQNTQTIFGVPQIFELPEELKETALAGGAKFAEFVSECGKLSGISLSEIMIVPDKQSLATKEYQHTQAKKKFLDGFAVQETEAVISDSTSNYSIINFPYGTQYGKSTAKTELTSALFAMPLSLIENLRKDFEKHNIKIIKIIPQDTAMLLGSSSIINSVNKVVALLSIDLFSVRITVINNGEIQYSQMFESPLPEIAHYIADEKQISYLEAISYIEEEGVVSFLNSEVSPLNLRSVQSTLDYTTGDIIRNVRMMLASKKLEINKVYLCDHFSLMPDLTKYMRQYGFLMEVEDVGVSYKPENIPIVTDTAVEIGYKSSSFFTLSNIVTLANMNTCDLLHGINSAKNKNSNLGKYLTVALGVIVGVSMVAVGGLYAFNNIMLYMSQQMVADPKYDPAKQVIADTNEYNTKIANVNNDVLTLPVVADEVSNIVDETFKQVTENVEFVSSYSFDNIGNQISLTFVVDDFEAYVKLKDEINSNEYFKVVIPVTYTQNSDEGNGTCTTVLSVNPEVISQEQQEAQTQDTTQGGNQ